jgi:hypothetical protein
MIKKVFIIFLLLKLTWTQTTTVCPVHQSDPTSIPTGTAMSFTFNSNASVDPQAQQVLADNFGNFYLAFEKSAILKVNSSLLILWQITFTPTSQNYGNSMQLSPDGSKLVYSFSASNKIMFIDTSSGSYVGFQYSSMM